MSDAEEKLTLLTENEKDLLGKVATYLESHNPRAFSHEYAPAVRAIIDRLSRPTPAVTREQIFEITGNRVETDEIMALLSGATVAVDREKLAKWYTDWDAEIPIGSDRHYRFADAILALFTTEGEKS